jgi:hypothetical protein
MNTIKHSLKILKGIFSDTLCDLGDGHRMAEYMHDMNADSQSAQIKWQNAVCRSWNGILTQEKTVFDKDTLMDQLNSLDKIFDTHCKGTEGLIMTSGNAWKQVFSMYISAVVKHLDTVARLPEADKCVVTIRESAARKVIFVTQDHKKLHNAPPFPLLTKSVIPMLSSSLDSIKDALTEVCKFS